MNLLQPKFIIAAIGGAVTLFLTWDLVPLELWVLLGVVTGLAAVPRLVAESSGSAGRMRFSTTGIQDDLETVQQFLADTAGHYRFDLWNHADSVNEDTLEKKLDGEKQEFYAVVGIRYNPADEYNVAQLFVLNKTKGRKHAYYRDVTNSTMKQDPLYRHYKRRFLKTEGRADGGEGDGGRPVWVGENINVENGQQHADEREG